MAACMSVSSNAVFQDDAAEKFVLVFEVEVERADGTTGGGGHILHGGAGEAFFSHDLLGGLEHDVSGGITHASP